MFQELSAALTDRTCALIARALADPRRYAIVRELACREDAVPASDLRRSHDIGAATISHHLRQLEIAGLIEIVRKGKSAGLAFRTDLLAAYLARLAFQPLPARFGLGIPVASASHSAASHDHRGLGRSGDEPL